MPVPTQHSTSAQSPAYALLDRLEIVSVAVASDCLDSLGVTGQVMKPRIRPLDPSIRTWGVARTVQLTEVDAPPADSQDYYKLELESVDVLSTGDVVVTSTTERSYWGELLATACRARGVRGIVADAYTRDTSRLMEMGFPTFVSGIQAQDSLGRLEVSAYDVPISSGGVTVNPFDIVIADADGVVIIPLQHAEQVIAFAEEKLSTEDDMRIALAEGMSMADAFKKFGVL